MLNRIKKRHIVLVSLLALISLWAVFYFNGDEPNIIAIRAYEEKDFKPLLKIMNDNLFWISEHADLNTEKVLTLKAPHNDETRKGEAHIDVITVLDEPKGFISYFKRGPSHGFIWLLAVDKDQRKKGFGEQLVAHAIHELKKQGATYATLAAKTMNKPAISLYKKMGFVEETRDDERGVVFLIRHKL
jgi:ribosomal protein S18 acetylase RimI-like enzyme